MLEGAFGQLCRTLATEIAHQQLATLRVKMLAALLAEAAVAIGEGVR